MPDENGSALVDARLASGQISRFFGIVIAMSYSEQEPSHFHARYGEHEALIAIETLDYVEGWLPKRAHALVLEWAGPPPQGSAGVIGTVRYRSTRAPR